MKMRGWFCRGILLWIYASSAVSIAQAAGQDVNVTNFPQTQNIKGSVNVDGTVSHGRSVKREGVLVQTSRRSDANDLTYAGVIDTEGFTTVTVSLEGEIKSTNFPTGTVGVLLLPDEDPIWRVLREAKIVQFPIECVASVNRGDSEYFTSPQCLDRIAFPRYRIYLYNTMNRTVEANVYLYLTN
jgi:hypothetical protein